MTRMVERVASVIFPGHGAIMRDDPEYRRQLDVARAAIAAMREPTDGMVLAVYVTRSDQRDSVIEECKQALVNIACLHCGTDNTDRLIKRLDTLKEKP